MASTGLTRARAALRRRAARTWTQMPGEIVGDDFAELITELAADPRTRTMCEVGSGAGDGSTRAFVRGADRRDDPPQLFCIETVESRAQELRDRYADRPFVHTYVSASATAAAYPSKQYVMDFHRAFGSRTGRTPDDAARTLEFELDFLASTGIAGDAIAQIKRDHDIEHFDLVLLDGSSFTGEHDLDQVHGARWLLLDDTAEQKNLATCLRLLGDPAYRLMAANPQTRNGWAAFERVTS